MADAKKIIIALILGLALGALSAEIPQPLSGYLFETYSFFGSLFLNGLKMIIVPLVASSIITGIAGIGGARDLRGLSLKTFSYYMVTSLVAVITGLILVNLFTPGEIQGKSLTTLLELKEFAGGTGIIEDKVGTAGFKSVLNVFLEMVPPNIIKAAAEGQMLGIISFSLLFGLFIPRIGHEYSETLFKFICGVHEIMMAITELVMKFAPLGILCLVAKVVTEAGGSNIVELLKGLGLFALTVALGLFIHVFFTLFLTIRHIAKASPLSHFRAMAPALVTAFSTASSSATLPITMECLEKRLGVSERITGFVIPLGATINMDGTALYECVAALFIAQALGFEMSFLSQFVVVWTALLTSIGVAGIPAASLVAIAIILKAVGLPVEAMAIILPVDRLLDMLRTSVNVFSDSVGALIVSKFEERQKP